MPESKAAATPGTGSTRRRGFSNQFVFAKVMFDNVELCRELIEVVLDMRISHVEHMEVETCRPQIDKRSVRFDVFLEGDGASFEVEMQAYDEGHLPQRMRYYRSQIDRLSLSKGMALAELKPVYIIFICTYDPFGRGLPVYTFRSTCSEDPTVPFDDGAVSVALNASGDLSMTSEPIAELLQYVATGRTDGALSARLDQAVDEAYRDEEWVRRMDMIEWEMENMRRAAETRGNAEGFNKGLSEGLREGLSEGTATEHARIIALVNSMRETGYPDGEILAAVCAEATA